MLSSSRGLILGFIILIQCAISSLAFISANKFRTHQISLLRSKPEFSVVGEEELPDTDIQEPDTDGFYVVKPSTGSPSTGVRPEYGALSVGTVVQVQVGDVSLARKAWKKRRRTGSPLLVPCSILNVDRGSMVRWNFMFLLEKFGRARSDGIEISTTELSKKYRTFLKSSMQVGYQYGIAMCSPLQLTDMFLLLLETGTGTRFRFHSRLSGRALHKECPGGIRSKTLEE